MIRTVKTMCFILMTGCAANGGGEPTIVGGGGGKADGPGDVPATGTWTRESISSDAELWNGGPVGWGGGTTIAMRQSGTPIIAYYDATNRCNNGGWGTYSPDTLQVARVGANGWNTTIEACGPYAGYWPRLRVDSADRTHLVFGAGWWSAGPQHATYVRWTAADQRDTWTPFDSAYMDQGALALTLDDMDAPTFISDGAVIEPGGTKTRLFASDTSRTFAERDASGALHVVGSTFIPDPADPNTSTARMRYAHRDASGITVEIPGSQPNAVPLGLVLDSTGTPHVLSWNSLAMGGGELRISTRGDTGWTDEVIASGIYDPTAAIAISASDEVLVVAPGELYRRDPVAATWTSTAASALGSAKYLSAVVAPDGALHVAFEIVGPIMSNEVSRAYVYHASFR